MRISTSPRPILSVLVANRGEIAVRIMRTCARLGLRTIAVYSDADAATPHVTAADDAICIGPAEARRSYLDMDAVISAALRTEADAIHPGYGFLSENAGFARRCEEAGLVFIGPSAQAIERMGSKIMSKRIAEAAGVPTVPGYHGDAQDIETLAREARRIGYPVMIKASAGGGGRGMRRVDRAEDFAAACSAARTEAQSAFGDGSLLLEKLIEAPRHLEVQLFGDRHGHLVHLFERDCSIQRNNQKLVEEAPAPNLSDAVRRKLYDAALRLGRAIGYDNAGTVEFIMATGGGEPYFLEMNTRLQVEHPVTEAITGIDLVEWQLIAAAGDPLPLSQTGIQQRGHAIEVRLTAERADRSFQPATGRIVRVTPPRGLRMDSGIASGSVVGASYDSMLAKLIAHGRTRSSAAARLVEGLCELELLGLATTQPFLRDVLRGPLFANGPVTTGFISSAYPQGWVLDPAELRRLRAAAAAAWTITIGTSDASQWASPWFRIRSLRVTRSVRPATADLRIFDEYGEADAQIRDGREGLCVDIGEEVVELGHVTLEDGRLRTAIGTFSMAREGSRLMIGRGGCAIEALVSLLIDAALAKQEPERTGDRVTAPLHGLVSQIFVGIGDSIAEGAPVAQMEAMKLVHTLAAPAAGTVAEIRHAVGEIVPSGTVLIKITPTLAEEKS